MCINPGASLEVLNAVFVDTDDIEGSMQLVS